MSKAKLDALLGSWVSRKLFAFAVACVFLVLGYIHPDHWQHIAIAYVGGQALVDSVGHWRTGRIVGVPPPPSSEADK